MSLGEILKKQRADKKWTLGEVAMRVGISKPYLSNIENDKVRHPPSDGVLDGLSNALGMPKAELRRIAHLERTPLDIRGEHERLFAEVEKLRSLIRRLAAGKTVGKVTTSLKAAARRLGGDNVSDALSAGRAVPIINRVSAGYPMHFTDLDYPPSVADDYVRCPDVHDPQAFAARVVGDSMEPKYSQGDLIIFAPNVPVDEGSDCFIRFVADGATTFKRFYSMGEDKIRLQPLNDKYPPEIVDREEISGVWPAVMRVERLR